jgi:hypothetical protein
MTTSSQAKYHQCFYHKHAPPADAVELDTSTDSIAWNVGLDTSTHSIAWNIETDTVPESDLLVVQEDGVTNWKKRKKEQSEKLWNDLRANSESPTNFGTMYEQSKSQKFFETCYLKGEAVSSLVALAVSGSRSLARDITPDFQRLHIMFARFSQKISQGLQNELEKLVHLLSRCVRSTVMNEIEVANGTAAPIYNPGIPDSKGSFRRLYRDDGIISNLPCPEIHSKNGHAFVKLREVIAHHFGHGKDVDFLGAYTSENESVPATVRSLAESKQASQIFRAACTTVVDGSVLPLWIVLWSDDFEPNTLLQNRGSVWALTATISTPNETSNSASNTYVLVLGPTVFGAVRILCDFFSYNLCCKRRKAGRRNPSVTP